MFFGHLLRIGRSDLVLEVGPGSVPHWRSDFLVDRHDGSEPVVAGTFGGERLATRGKPFLKIEGELPFRDDAFDYVICSHVLEHVPADGIGALLDEIFRVAPKAYLEFPAPLYDIVYQFEAHRNFLDIDGDTIYCLPKERASCLNPSFGAYAMFLRKRFRYHAARGQEHLIAVGKEFRRGELRFEVVKNEEEFFAIVERKSYYCRKAPVAWRLYDRLRGEAVFRFSTPKKWTDYRHLFRDSSVAETLLGGE